MEFAFFPLLIPSQAKKLDKPIHSFSQFPKTEKQNQPYTMMMTMIPTESTIFKRHETRHLRQSQESTSHPSPPAMKIDSVDDTFGETLRKMKTRSTIYHMHQQRHATIPVSTRHQQQQQEQTNHKSHSFLDWTSKSTIYQRHAKRASA